MTTPLSFAPPFLSTFPEFPRFYGRPTCALDRTLPGVNDGGLGVQGSQTAQFCGFDFSRRSWGFTFAFLCSFFRLSLSLRVFRPNRTIEPSRTLKPNKVSKVFVAHSMFCVYMLRARLVGPWSYRHHDFVRCCSHHGGYPPGLLSHETSAIIRDNRLRLRLTTSRHMPSLSPATAT
ncbi:unnamed protein product [Scytosiphon promiscuus]